MTAPITSALRRLMTAEGARVTADRDEFCGICDAVDSIHARKLKALDASTRRVDELCKENERLRGLCVKALEWLRWAGGITCPPEVPDEFADNLHRENAKLRGQVVSLTDRSIRMADKMECLNAENESLRELVRDMWKRQEALPYGAHIEIRDRMRELGVEVDG